MRVLYVTTSGAPDATSVLADIYRLEAALDVKTVIGAAGALVEIRTAGGYAAVFIAPSVPHNEALALIASLRRDRIPIAIVAIITDGDRDFFAPAVTAGADDVLVLRGKRLVAVEDTLRRVRQNRHVSPEPGKPRLRVLYAGHDQVTYRLISEIPFAEVSRTNATEDGKVSMLMTEPARSAGQPGDVLVVDEYPGAAHALQIVKWVKAEVADLPVVLLAAATAGDLGGAALELGADEVISKAGTYRRRLVASLHRIFLGRLAVEDTSNGGEPGIIRTPASDERDSDQRDHLDETAASVEALRAENERLIEAQAFERALRDRDREELASFRRALREEQERRIVLEGTLRHTEDRAKAELSALEEALNEERRRLEENVADAADRLHQVASTTHVLQDRLDRQLAERETERERLVDNPLVGQAVFTRDGRLVRCTPTFASMLGYDSAAEAVDMSKARPFSGTPDHGRVVEVLDQGQRLERVESTIRRRDGRPLRVLTSASLLPSDEIERLFIDLTDRVNLEVELRLARRLEGAGRLAAEMEPEIESALRAASAALSEHRRVATLVRQLLAFSRYQAKPAGFLSLNDAISRHESLLRQIAGESIDMQIRLGEIEPVTAGEDEIEHLLIELTVSAAGVLPYGGELTLTTASETDPTFVLRTSLTAVSAGYGVLSANPSPSLARLVARCGGVLQITGDAGRSSTLHVFLPC